MIDFKDFPRAEKVFRYFEEISKIPHGSSDTKKIADYLINFANERKLLAIRDEYDNVIIKKPATPGFEHRPVVILQGHTDMVIAKSPDSKIDPEKDGILIYRDGDLLRAEGTTLGGDDGIAVAYMLAILDSDNLEHPFIEALFTSDEEIGLIGAGGLDPAHLSGRIMINIDSDIEGIFTVSCAGGVRVDLKLPLVRGGCDGNCFSLRLYELTGGHSGIEIDKNRENAIKCAAELISLIPDAKIIDFKGGNADNAIPREAEVSFISSLSESEIEGLLSDSFTALKKSEPTAKLCIEKVEGILTPYTKESSEKILSLIKDEPNGVQKMSDEIDGLVETSLNLGLASLCDDEFNITFSIRSSKDSAKAELLEKVKNIGERYGANSNAFASYPAWEYKKESHLREVMCDVYEKMYDKAPAVIAIHAGLECGIFSGKLEGLDCVSIGPDNFDIHTPSERLSISSSARVYDYLLEVLKNI